MEGAVLAHKERRIFLGAAIEPLTLSGPVQRSPATGCFKPENVQDHFDVYHRVRFGGEHSKYSAWILFGVGAENLLRAALKCQRIEPKHGAALGQLVKTYLPKLCPGHQEAMAPLVASHGELKDVRNRDAYSYEADMRGSDFPLVESDFAPSFNVLVAAMRENGHWGDT